MKLYRWQEEWLDRWEQNGCRGILRAVTGAGKTVAALAAIRRLAQRLNASGDAQPLRVRVVAPTVVIARQWVQVLRGEGWETGIWYGAEKDSADRFCTVYVVNSARHAISGHIIRDMRARRPVLFIADECHHYGSKENAKIFHFRSSRYYNDALYHAVGLSATPACEHLEDVLAPALGEEIYRYGLGRAIRDGVVSPFAVFQIAVGFTGKEAEAYGRMTNRLRRLYAGLLCQYPILKDAAAFFPRVQALADKMENPNSLPAQYLALVKARRNLCLTAENRLHCALALIRALPRDRRVILFCERISQAEQAKAYLRDNLPLQTGICHSEMTDEKRREVLRDFRDGVIRVLVSCKALDEGVDVPDALVGIVLSSTLTERQRVQRLGRILRRASGKRRAVLYYLYVNGAADEMNYLSEENERQLSIAMTYIPPQGAAVSSGKAVSPDFSVPSGISPVLGAFECPAYADPASKVYREAEASGLSPEKLKELRCLLNEGILSPDWLESPGTLDEMLRQTTSRSERNHFIVMKLIAQKREELKKSYEDLY